jgi:ABC-type glycerol-3-phosphate transport system substrate-binding protein
MLRPALEAQKQCARRPVGEEFMKSWRPTALARLAACAAVLSCAALGTQRAHAAETLNICHNGHPIMEASIKIIDKWAKQAGINVTSTPISYTIYLAKMTQILATGSPQCDIVWHNDDWGQIWKQYLVTTDDVSGIGDFPKQPLDAFWNDEHKLTVVPMVHTVGTFFYRTDLLAENEVPKTLAELVQVGEKLQKAGKVKWGYVGGMSMNNTWFSLWWSMWNNQCDILKPIYARTVKEWAAENWTPIIDQPCHQEIVEYWWDALHKSKISPEAMTTYSRDEANAIFEAGDAAFTVADSTFWGDFNNKSKSLVAGKVGMAKFPFGPRRTKPISWDDIWGWAIPKAVSPEHQKLAKQILGAMLTDVDGQLGMWNETGGPPPSVKAFEVLQQKNPVFQKLQHAVFDDEHVHSAYYFAYWPQLHKAYSDVAIKALTGSREAIPQVLKDGVKTLHEVAAGQ